MPGLAYANNRSFAGVRSSSSRETRKSSMWFSFKLVLLGAMAICSLQVLWAQDLAPRAYIITPLHSNAITLTWGFYDGGLNFNGTVPITGATGTYSVPVVSYYHSFGFF